MCEAEVREGGCYRSGLRCDAKVVLAAPCVVGSAACDTTPARQPPPRNHPLHRNCRRHRRRRRRRHPTRRAAAGGAAPRRHRRAGCGAGAHGPARGLLLPVRCVPCWGKRCGLSLPANTLAFTAGKGAAQGAPRERRRSTHAWISRWDAHTVLTWLPGCMQVTSAPARAPSGWGSTRQTQPKPQPKPEP